MFEQWQDFVGVVVAAVLVVLVGVIASVVEVLCSNAFGYVYQPFCVTDKYGRRLSVPCGKCYECLREKQQEWCFRLDQELKHANVSFFVTLTYATESLIFADDEPCLYKRHLQLHFKKIRKKLEPKSVKYFAVGEYGDSEYHTGRPHYHYLIFYKGDLDRFRLMMLIKESWDFGISQVLPVNGAQGYVTKYILKFDDRDHLVPPFSMISNGLGLDYLSDEVVCYHRQNLQPFGVKPGGFKVNLPRYYKDKIFSPYQRLVMKKQSDLYRHQQDLIGLEKIDALMDLGISPFRLRVNRYQMRLYNSLKLYRQKKKL